MWEGKQNERRREEREKKSRGETCGEMDKRREDINQKRKIRKLKRN